MARQITIDPVTRIEGHAKITIQLDDSGAVQDAHFHVTQFRGFEKLCEGRPFTEMPSLMARICGICPVSHLIASAKACDAILTVRIPETAVKLRRILNLAQVIQSHALSFFYLSSPDFLLGMDSDPAHRNLFGVLQANPTLAKDGIRLRQFGQQIIERLGGKRIHPSWVVPGGVNEPLTAEGRDAMLAAIPEALVMAERTLGWFKEQLDGYAEEIEHFGNFPSAFLGMVTPDGKWEHYDGQLRLCDTHGEVIAADLDPTHYQEFIGEAVEPWSYLKSPYYKPQGYPGGMYRVGPLARLNLVERMGTARADAELSDYRTRAGWPALSSFHYHQARLVEILHCIERIDELLRDPDIMDPHVRAFAQPNSRVGIGVSEAPRGTLLHHYEVDENGLMMKVNLIIATGHNNLAMNRGVLQVARHFLKSEQLSEGMLNRVEAVIRTYDPCLSCSTHALGQMPLQIQLLSPTGTVLEEVKRG